MHENSEIRLNAPAIPFFLEFLAVGSANIDMIESTCDRVKPCRIYDKVEFVFRLRGLDTCCRDALDRRF